MTRPLSVQCPCCQAKLQVDPVTGAAQAAKSGAAGPLGDLGAAVRKAEAHTKSRKLESESAFSQALDAERRRKADLVDLFRKASAKHGEDDPQAKPDTPLDDRWR
ncbi:MAG TPA: hypothetical protein VGC54_01365 [Planctomycetota bacterium]